MAFLHRLRLRLGLFRWKNYAWIDEGVWEWHDRVSPFRGIQPACPLITRRQVVRHIRRCVRQGVRP